MATGTSIAIHAATNHTVPLLTITVRDGLNLSKVQAPSTTLASVGVQQQKQCLARAQQGALPSLQQMSEKMGESELTSDLKANRVAKDADLETPPVADCLLVACHEKLALRNYERYLLNTAT
jgi:hypothetical protein